MEWSKLKNIIILLLAATNLGLFSFVWGREWKQSRQLEQARAQAIEFLDSHSVETPNDQIPERMELLPRQVERDLGQEQAAAASLLAGQVQQERWGIDAYRYFNENGWVQFQGDGTFSANFSAGFLPLGDNRKKTCVEVLERLGFEASLVKAEWETLTFCQNWEGVPLFNQQVTLRCGGEELVAITAGRRLMGVPTVIEGWEPVTVATAIFDFYNGLTGLGDVCSRVDAIQQGYVSSVETSGPVTLIPVWRVDTDTGRYQLDTMTGQLTRLT